MNADTPDPKTELPVTHAVVVHHIRAGVPSPVAAFEFRCDGHVMLRGPAACGMAWPLLMQSAKMAGVEVARQHLTSPKITTSAPISQPCAD